MPAFLIDFRSKPKQDGEAGSVWLAPGTEGCDDLAAMLAAVLDRHTWPAVASHVLLARGNAPLAVARAARALRDTEYGELGLQARLHVLEYLVGEAMGSEVCLRVCAYRFGLQASDPTGVAEKCRQCLAAYN